MIKIEISTNKEALYFELLIDFYKLTWRRIETFKLGSSLVGTPKDDTEHKSNLLEKTTWSWWLGTKIEDFETTLSMDAPFMTPFAWDGSTASRKIQLVLKLSRTCCEELLVQTFNSVVCTSSETSKVIKPFSLDSKHDVVIYFGKGLWPIIQGFTCLF